MDEVQNIYKEPTRKDWWGFWTLLVVQAQNALNEKAAQFLLIPLGFALNAESNLQYTLGAIIVLPYLFISPFVGWLSDRFCKTRIVQAMALMQILVLLGMWFSLINHNIHGAIVWFTVFAIQATVLSPAKKGIVKDIVGIRHIGFGSGLVEMSSMLALIVAQVGVFIVYAKLLNSGYSTWEASSLPTFCLMLLAVPVALVTLCCIPRYPVHARKPFRWSLFYEHFTQIKELWSDRRTRLSEIGISYFWFYATAMLLLTLQVAQESASGITTGAGEEYSMMAAVLMAWMSGGVVVGGVIVSLICRSRVEIGTIPLGASGMTISCILMACFEVNSYPFLISLSAAGLSSAFFFVPLNGYLQNSCEDSRRGNIIAAGNCLDMAMALFAVVFQYLLKEMGISIGGQCVIMAVLCLGITIIVFRLIPREFIKLLGLWAVQLFFRPRVLNVDRMPETGGALLISNHVTFVDALLLTMVCSRPIRFVVAEEYIGVRALGWVLELFNCVPISNKNPREALNAAAAALKNGEVICIFPEGQLTRTGVMSTLRRGFEIIAHRAQAPVVPVFMDGLWGGLLSCRSVGSFVKWPGKVPLRFTVSYGEPMAHGAVTPELARKSFQELSVVTLDAVSETGRSALRRTLERQNTRSLVFWKGGEWRASDILTAFLENRTPRGDSPGHEWMRLFVSMLSDRNIMGRMWLNAIQLQKVNALQPGQPLLTSVGEKEGQEHIIAVFWPLLTRTPVHLVTDEEAIPEGVEQIAGSWRMREKLQSIIPLKHKIPFFDFSGEKTLPTLPNITSRPCFVGPRGEIIAVSMWREVYAVDEDFIQFGLKFGGHGLLLPGFTSSVNEAGRTVIHGPSLAGPVELPASWHLDESNFLVEDISLH